jgi:hypothetical protein
MHQALHRAIPAVLVLGTTLGACNESTGPNGNGNGNGPPIAAEVFVLNSLSKTISQFVIRGDALESAGAAITLPANFDGVAFDMFEDLWTTTVSAAGGSQIIFGSLSTGQQATSTFPGAAGALADPSKPTIVVDLTGNIGAIVGARADNSAYIAFPGATAQLLAPDVGEFVERVLPVVQALVAVDANLDDVGGTYQPLGDPRAQFNNLLTGEFIDEVPFVGATNANEAVFFQDDVLVLAGGGFGPAPAFAPNNDGQIILMNVIARQVVEALDLEGNGISLEVGRNSLNYITRTTGNDFGSTDLLVYNLTTQSWVQGPNNPLQPRDASGADLNCWAASALLDSRIVCVTFSFGTNGRLVLLDANGAFLDEAVIGQGATDLIVR